VERVVLKALRFAIVFGEADPSLNVLGDYEPSQRLRRAKQAAAAI
jgi:hypothetical protein